MLGNDCHILLIRLHRREQENLLDVTLVGEKHGETINAETKATGRGKTVFEGGNKRVVHNHGFVVTLLALSSLVDESLILNDGIVQLGIRICEL